MIPTYRNSDNSDAAFTRPAMSEACRLDIYGKLLPMARPEGEPSLLQGTALLIGMAIVVMLLIVAFG